MSLCWVVGAGGWRIASNKMCISQNYYSMKIVVPLWKATLNGKLKHKGISHTGH